MDPLVVLILIFAVFVPVGIILALVVFPAMRRRNERSSGGASAADDLRDEPPLDQP
jgi:hypothetical protein